MITIDNEGNRSRTAEVLVVGVRKDQSNLPNQVYKEAGEQAAAKLEKLWKNGEIATNSAATSIITPVIDDSIDHILFVGLGSTAKQTLPSFRDTLGKATKELVKLKKSKATILLDSFTDNQFRAEVVAEIIADAANAASYRFDVYKSKKEKLDLPQMTLHTEIEDIEKIKEYIEVGEACASGVNYARTLVNTPASDLPPPILAEKARELSERHARMEAEILDQEALESLGMHALLAVNRGSDQPARMIVLRYQGKESWKDPLTFVGKGLTFDTGGYSLKPAGGMQTMKSDMGGAAAVLGAMETIGLMQPNANVMAVIPSTENLVNGSAMKPGDVLHTYDGQTIEVNNTDAEGRLILADGVAYARELGAAKLVDVATLTGACAVALGDAVTGAVANDDAFYEELTKAAEQAGEAVWRFPAHHPRYNEMLRSSNVADLNNAPGRLGGAITAGLFIEAFTGGLPWIHLDVAGTAFLDRETPLGPKGGTGVMVRTLSSLARIQKDID